MVEVEKKKLDSLAAKQRQLSAKWNATANMSYYRLKYAYYYHKYKTFIVKISNIPFFLHSQCTFLDHFIPYYNSTLTKIYLI